MNEFWRGPTFVTQKASLVGIALVMAASIAFGLASSASGALHRSAAAVNVAYEPFCYTAAGTAGSGGSGWTGGWSAGLVSAPGLVFTGFPTSGAACSPNNALGPAGDFVSRAVASPVTPSNAAGVILRALIRSNVTGTDISQATLGNLTGGTLTIGDFPETTIPAASWGIQVNGGAKHFSTVPVQLNQTVALTARVDFGGGTGGQDLVTLWVQTSGTYCNPTGPVGSPGCAGGTAVSGNAMSSFSKVFWQTNGAGALVDEISVDAIPKAAGRLCVQKFWDRNEDGTQQANEPYLPGWTMDATGGPSAPFSLKTTGAKMICKSVVPGAYTLTETVQPGWAATTPATGSQSVTVTENGTVTAKFGNRRACDPRKPTRITALTPAGGVADNFLGQQPATKPLAFGAASKFDWPNADQAFYHEFRKLPHWPTICKLTLDIRLKPSNSGSANDSLTLSAGTLVAPRWQQNIGTLTGTPWTGTTPSVLSLSFTENGGLPAGNNAADGPVWGKNIFVKFRSTLPALRMLDVSLQDDTSVDYIKLTVHWQQ